MSANLVNAPDQADLTLDWPPHELARVPWRRSVSQHGEVQGQYPGVAELAEQRHLDTCALLNDLKRAGINADVRLNAEAFAELLRDEHRPIRGMRPLRDEQGNQIGFQIQGPGPEEYLPNNTISAHYRPGTHWWTFTTTGWTEVPAFVAHWFWWAQRDDARLGAGYSRVKTRDERDPDESRNAVVPMPGVVSRMRLRYEADEESGPVPAQLFAIRMVSERAPGERPSGLLVPGVAANADELAALRAELATLRAQLSKTPAKGEKG